MFKSLIITLLFTTTGAFASADYSLYCDSEFTNNNVYTCESPKFAKDGQLYSLAQGSDFDAICSEMGYKSGAKEYYNPRSVIPAGLKVTIDSDLNANFVDETEGCFGSFCLTFKGIIIPAPTLKCNVY
jgi:hypothetical protein